MNDIFLVLAFWLSMLGAIIAICCYLPGVIKVVRFNDTRSISAWMFLLTTIGCILWIVIAIFLMIGYSRVGGDNIYFNLASGMGTLLSNIGLGICSGTIFVKKLINVIHARCENMTEDEYYKKVIEPIVTEKLAKQRKLKKEAKENYEREKQRESDYIEQYRNELESENKSDDPQSDLL